MTPVERAKEKVYRVFFALGAHEGQLWQERISGGWETSRALVSCNIRGFVSMDGYYEIGVCNRKWEQIGTLIAGSMGESPKQYEAMGMAEKAVPSL